MLTAETLLPQSARALFEPFAYATLSTINPDVSPQVTLVVAFLDETEAGTEIVLFHRDWYQKLRNITRNSAVALTIVPPMTEQARPGALPPYLVVHGTARINEGDAGPWSTRLMDVVRSTMPGIDIPDPPMPDNGGWTTHITPKRLVGMGPWM